MSAHKTHDHTPTTNRIELFSDAVIAISATLLILEIKIPALSNLSNDAVIQSLLPLIPKFISFAVSFVTICVFWVNHHHFFHAIRRSDRALLWYNNHLLFWIAVIPFVTGFIGEYPSQPIIVALYGFVLTMGALAFLLMANYVFLKSKIADEHVPIKTRRKEVKRSVIGVFVYGISVLTAFIHPYISLIIFIVIPFYYFLPETILNDTEEEIY